MEENKSKFDFVKKIFGFKQCACLDKKIPKIRAEKKVENKEDNKSCCSNKGKK